MTEWNDPLVAQSYVLPDEALKDVAWTSTEPTSQEDAGK